MSNFHHKGRWYLRPHPTAQIFRKVHLRVDAPESNLSSVYFPGHTNRCLRQRPATVMEARPREALVSDTSTQEEQTREERSSHLPNTFGIFRNSERTTRELLF
ncbi:hypothetical protein AVEN_164578-1 [Araneus ventricosus]|uniref:Uncharacterized protein n=1 Tax=Araneus ventricosus TaxID=182803 RepID=A0A4Y2B527_ARAVE|nr:hypothetical protein AVEN_164578-1 [Araneus ventricosus]